MNDPSKSPGYGFQGIRLISASVLLVERLLPQAAFAIRFEYSDGSRIDGKSLVVVQNMKVTATPENDAARELLRVHTELEGTFEIGDAANIKPDDFANNYAPPIMFPFTREWIYRLTSDCAPLPPVLLPPINILRIREAAIELAARATQAQG
jgi:preprotein translocase subunit SecB